MVYELGKTTKLTGVSGKEYLFNLWTFDDFDDVKQTFRGCGLYLFTNRHLDGGKYRHTYIYIGQTGDFYTRYNNHHKENCLRNQEVNCIGFFSMPNSVEEDRKTVENDILSKYDFPCNTI